MQSIVPPPPPRFDDTDVSVLHHHDALLGNTSGSLKVVPGHVSGLRNSVGTRLPVSQEVVVWSARPSQVAIPFLTPSAVNCQRHLPHCPHYCPAELIWALSLLDSLLVPEEEVQVGQAHGDD